MTDMWGMMQRFEDEDEYLKLGLDYSVRSTVAPIGEFGSNPAMAAPLFHTSHAQLDCLTI